jgi:hypothetical protein
LIFPFFFFSLLALSGNPTVLVLNILDLSFLISSAFFVPLLLEGFIFFPSSPSIFVFSQDFLKHFKKLFLASKCSFL